MKPRTVLLPPTARLKHKNLYALYITLLKIALGCLTVFILLCAYFVQEAVLVKVTGYGSIGALLSFIFIYATMGSLKMRMVIDVEPYTLPYTADTDKRVLWVMAHLFLAGSLSCIIANWRFDGTAYREGIVLFKILPPMASLFLLLMGIIAYGITQTRLELDEGDLSYRDPAHKQTCRISYSNITQIEIRMIATRADPVPHLFLHFTDDPFAPTQFSALPQLKNIWLNKPNASRIQGSSSLEIKLSYFSAQSCAVILRVLDEHAPQATIDDRALQIAHGEFPRD